MTWMSTTPTKKEERRKNPQGPPNENLFAAATFIKRLFVANEIECATIGGFAMILRDFQRQTRDVDVVVSAPMARLWDVIRQQPRYPTSSET